MPPADCILVGYNDVDFRVVERQMFAMRAASGAYRNLLNNSLEWDHERITYMELLNRILRSATGREYHLNVGRLPALSVCYLASYLRRRQFDVRIVNFFNHEKDEFARLLLAGARAVAITTTLYVEPSPIQEIVEFVRSRCPDARIIVGGPHILSVCHHDEVTQDYVFSSIGADLYVNDSQGEQTLARVLEALRQTAPDLSEIPNLIVREGMTFQSAAATLPASTGSRARATLVRTPRQIESNDMNAEAVNWGLISSDCFTPIAPLRTARSCAYSCSFCKYPIVAGPLSLMGIDAVERELELLVAGGVTHLNIVDDTFNIPLRRFKELLRMMIRRRFGLQWVSFFRCAEADEETFDLMSQSGCRGVFLGIESGDQEVLNNMNKRASVSRYEDGIRQLHARGITTFASFIVGFPGETRDSVQRTIDFIERCRPTFYSVELYYHATDLPVQEQAERYGLRGAGYSWSHNSMDWQTASDLVDRLHASVRNSRLLPLYMFSFWGLHYLVSRGMSIDQMKEFADLTKTLLMNGQQAPSPTNQAIRERCREQLLAFGRKIAPGIRPERMPAAPIEPDIGP